MVADKDQNRRTYPRVEAPVYCRPARLRLTPLPVSNIGFGGMRVYSDDANKVGQLLDIDVLVDGDAATCTVEVAWISRLADPAPAKYDVGLRFVSVPPGFLHYLTELTTTRDTGTVAIIIKPGHGLMATEPLRRIMTDVDNTAALIVHDGDEGCSCLTGIDVSLPWLERVSFVNADARRGHTFAINAALRTALGRKETAESYLLVAPDVVVETGAIKALHNVLVDQAHVGIVGSYVIDDTGEPQPTVFSFPSFATSVGPRRHEKTGQVPWVSMACAMIRRDVIDGIGLFDESMHDRFSAADFCRRAARAGWQTWLARDSHVTSGTIEPFGLEHTSSRDRPLFFASRDRFLSKNYSRVNKWLSVLGVTTRLLFTSLWSTARRGQLRDLWRYYLRPRWPAPAENDNPQK